MGKTTIGTQWGVTYRSLVEVERCRVFHKVPTIKENAVYVTILTSGTFIVSLGLIFIHVIFTADNIL